MLPLAGVREWVQIACAATATHATVHGNGACSPLRARVRGHLPAPARNKVPRQHLAHAAAPAADLCGEPISACALALVRKRIEMAAPPTVTLPARLVILHHRRLLLCRSLWRRLVALAAASRAPKLAIPSIMQLLHFTASRRRGGTVLNRPHRKTL